MLTYALAAVGTALGALALYKARMRILVALKGIVEVSPEYFISYAARQRCTVKRTFPAYVDEVSATGHCGQLPVDDLLMDKIAQTYGGGRYEVHIPVGTGGKVLTVFDIEGNPILKNAGKQKKGGEKKFFEEVGEELVRAKLSEDGGRESSGWKYALEKFADVAAPALAAFVTRSPGATGAPAGSPAQGLSEEQKFACTEMLRELAPAFLAKVEYRFSASKVVQALDKNFYPFVLDINPELASDFLKTHLSTMAPREISEEQRPSFAVYCVDVLVEVQKQIRAKAAPAAGQGGAA